MAERHPYISSQGALVQVIKHLRDSFPAVITSDTLKKLGFAPKNESFMLNILRFLKIIDENGNRMSEAQKVFTQHDNSVFEKQFSELVKSAYKNLFDLRGEKAWNLDTDALITFFRSSDHTTALVGKFQASTFQVLSALSGHGAPPAPKKSGAIKKATTKKPISKEATTPPRVEPPISSPKVNKRDLGLTVRVEINLPADGNQETYDRIFKSIRENLLNE